MSGVYDTDPFTWSRDQATLLRRLASGEKVNSEIDWANVIEEVENVGRSETRFCESYIVQIFVHILKIANRNDDRDLKHWSGEVLAFTNILRRSYTSSMHQKIDMPDLWQDALQQGHYDVGWSCPFLIEELIARPVDINGLVAKAARLLGDGHD